MSCHGHGHAGHHCESGPSIALEGLLRLAVRTSCCGRDNSGSNPGEDKRLHVFHSYFKLKKDPFFDMKSRRLFELKFNFRPQEKGFILQLEEMFNGFSQKYI